MANLGDLVVKITGDLTQFNKSINDAQAKMKATVGAFEKAGKSLTTFVTLPILALGTAFVKMADDAEKAEASLRNAINATGNAANVNVESIKAFALEMQGLSRYEDDAVVSSIAMLESLTALDEQGLKEVTPSILDLASAFQMDLQTAATLVGKTIGSDTNALSRYGIQVDASADKSTKLSQVIAQLQSKFGGAAKAAGETGVGALVKLKNEAGNLAEEFGSILIPEVIKLVEVLRGIVKGFSSLDEGTKKTIINVALVAAAVGPALLAFAKITQAAG